VNFVRPTELVRVVERLSESSKTAVLFDWEAVGPLGWNADAHVTLSIVDRPLGSALNELLEPMELTYRIVDAEVFQITSRRRLESEVDLELYSLAGLVDEEGADGLLENIRLQLGKDALHDAGGVGALRYDPLSQYLLAALPQPQQQQTEEFLHKLRAAAF
jgi:hypothetical protein